MKKSKIALKRLSAALTLCLLITLCSCAGTPKAEGVSVVTTFYPLYIFTRNLTDGIGGITVTNMTAQNTGCLHDYRLLTKDVKLLSDADLLVLCGAGMETFLDELLAQLPELRTADSSEGVSFLFEGAALSAHTAAVNAHIWMSVQNAVIEVNNICAALKNLCPRYADRLESNRTAYVARLEALYTQLKAQAAVFEGAPVVTFHEAFDYMAKEMAFTVAAAVESDEGGEPSAKKLAALSDVVKQDNIRVLFIEPGYTGSAADVLARETGAQICVLNPVTSGDGSLFSYEDIMRQNIRTIAEKYS